VCVHDHDCVLEKPIVCQIGTLFEFFFPEKDPKTACVTALPLPFFLSSLPCRFPKPCRFLLISASSRIRQILCCQLCRSRRRNRRVDPPVWVNTVYYNRLEVESNPGCPRTAHGTGLVLGGLSARSADASAGAGVALRWRAPRRRRRAPTSTTSSTACAAPPPPTSSAPSRGQSTRPPRAPAWTRRHAPRKIVA